MEFYRENTIKVLRELTRNCRFAEDLLRTSANDLQDENRTKIFLYYAEQNSGYIKKLNMEILRLGGSVEDIIPEETDYTYDINDIKERLKMCETGVSETVNNYRENALRDDILWEVVPVISKQYYGEMEAQEKIKGAGSIAV